MIPRKLQLRNFMCYREDLPPLDFDGINIACLSGENGSGKSALLDALTWALWGTARLRSDDDLIAQGAQEMLVDLTFALDGQDYRVTRKRSKGKRGKSELDFQVCNNGHWKTLSSEAMRDTQRTIIDTLHMEYDTFANSAFLRQGHADEFTRKEPGKRKQVLADILGLDVYERLEGGSKERAKGLDGQIKGIDGQIFELERQAEQREFHMQMVAGAEARVERLSDDVAAAEAALAQATALVQQFEALRPLRDEWRARLQKLRAEREQFAQSVAQARAALEEALHILARRDEITEGVAALHAAQLELERLDSLRAPYDERIEQRRVYTDAIRDAERRAQTDLRLAEGELKGLRDRAARRTVIEAEIAQLRKQLDGFRTLTGDLDAARVQRNELQEKSRTVGELRVKRAELDSQIKLKHDSLVGTREEAKRKVKDAIAKLKDADRWYAERERLSDERGHLDQERAQLDELRRVAGSSAERVGELRAHCAAIKAQGDDINRKLSMLNEDMHTCPLCNNELGHDGVAHIEQEYEQQRQAMRQQYTTAKREADTLEKNLTDIRAEVAVLERRTAALPEVVGRIARLEGDLAVADTLRREQAEHQRLASELDMQIVRGDFEHAVRAELNRVEAMIAALGDPASISRELTRLDAQIGKLEARVNEQANARAQLDAQNRALREIDAEAPALDAQERHVTELRRILTQNDYAHDERTALINLDAELTVLGYTPDAHTTARTSVRALQHWDDESRRIALAQDRIARDEQALQRDEQTLAQIEEEIVEATEQLTQIEQDLRELPAALHHRDASANELQGKRREFGVAQRDLGEKQGLLQRAEDAVAALLECQERRRKLVHRKGLFDELSTAFGKKGVQALLIETAIPEIEREANTLLANMTDNQMHLTFETQRDTKKGDVSETLEIKIADALGTRDYDAYSGGESFRVDFAIRIALAKLLARRAGARLETLVIDEGFGSQDARGRERLVEAITSVQPDFKQILVVTHIQELKDMFPVFIEVTKTPDGSRWAIG